MNPSAKQFLFLVGAAVPIAMLTFTNYQRFVGHQDYATRTATSLDSCEKIKKEIESQYDVESIPFVAQVAPESAVEKIKAIAKDASIMNADVSASSNDSIGESEYSVQKIRVRIPNRLPFYGLMSFVCQVVNTQANSDEEPPQRYWLSSFLVEAPREPPLRSGQAELWTCKELTLSYIVKSDKSP